MLGLILSHTLFQKAVNVYSFIKFTMSSIMLKEDLSNGC